MKKSIEKIYIILLFALLLPKMVSALKINAQIDNFELEEVGSNGSDLNIIETIETSDGGSISVSDFHSTILLEEEEIQPQSNDVIVIKYDSNSNIEWWKQIDGNGSEHAKGISEVEDGYMVYGYTLSEVFEGETLDIYGEAAIALKYDKSGNLLWFDVLDGSDSDYYTGVIEVEDGYVFYGYSNSAIPGLTKKGYEDGIIVKYDKTGNEIFKKNWGGNSIDEFANMIEVSDGYIIGALSASTDIQGVTNNGGLIAVIIKYDKDFNLLWQKQYVETGYDMVNKVTPLKEGFLVEVICMKDITFEDMLSSNDYYNVLVIYDNDGNQLQTLNLGLFGGWSITRDGGIITAKNVVEYDKNAVTEEEMIASFKADVYIKKYNKDGELEWQYDYDGESHDYIEFIEEFDGGLYQGVGETAISLENEESIGLKMFLTLEYDFTLEETTNGTYEVEQKDGKGVVTLNPNNGYILDTLSIKNSNRENVEYYEENGKYYFDLEDGLIINVTYKVDVNNPNTNTFLKLGFILVIVIAIYNLFISKKVKIKRFV